jgi:hypothetical protein
MLSGEDRRHFLGALVLTGASVAAFAESYRHRDGAGLSTLGDPLFDYIQHQLAAIIGKANLRGGVVGGEDAASAAACMRICAAHARGLDVDHLAQEAMTRRLARTSRTELMSMTPDVAVLRARLRGKGFTLGQRIAADLSQINHTQRVAAIDSIRAGRTVVICDRLAGACEAAAPLLAQKRRSVRTIAAQNNSWCSILGQRSTYLALVWGSSVIEDPALQGFVDSLWAGFLFYDHLYLSHC